MPKSKKTIDEKIKALQELKKKQQARKKEELFRKVFGSRWEEMGEKILGGAKVEIFVDGEKV